MIARVCAAAALLAGVGGLQLQPLRVDGVPEGLARGGGLVLSSHDLDARHGAFLTSFLPEAEDAPLKMAYVYTAKCAPSKTSKRPPGEQRRRNRADGRKKAKELSAALGVSATAIEVGEEESKWKPALDDADIVYVAGGNTYYLHEKCCRPGGFYDAMFERTADASKRPKAFVGVSAGAIICGDRLDTCVWKGWDDPSVLEDEDVVRNWETQRGLGLLGAASVFPHYEDQWAAIVERNSQGFAAKGRELLLLSQRSEPREDGAEAPAELIFRSWDDPALHSFLPADP